MDQDDESPIRRSSDQRAEEMKNIFHNDKGVLFLWTDRVELQADILDRSYAQTFISLTLEEQDFCRIFNIRTDEDLHSIAPEHLWEQYRIGNGRVTLDLGFLTNGADLEFTVENGYTIVEGVWMTYNDKVPGVLHDFDDMLEYLNHHVQDLFDAEELDPEVIS